MAECTVINSCYWVIKEVVNKISNEYPTVEQTSLYNDVIWALILLKDYVIKIADIRDRRNTIDIPFLLPKGGLV